MLLTLTNKASGLKSCRKLCGHEEFKMGDLKLVFNELYKNELDVNTFIVKPQEIQRMEVIEIIRKHDRVAMRNLMGDGSVKGATDGSLSQEKLSSYLLVTKY